MIKITKVKGGNLPIYRMYGVKYADKGEEEE